jgi:hypothetical protein
LLLLLTTLVAGAYESDTLTDRHLPLPDVGPALDQRVEMILMTAIAETNQRTRCDADPARAHRLLAREIHLHTATNELVTERGGLRALGFDRYSAWIEKGGVPRRSFEDRRDLFGTVRFRESPLLVWAGVCSTVNVNGVLVGTDKLDHFFEEGYDAWRRARFGDEPEQALEWATRTENGKYGLRSSETFSFADLRADADGMAFYDGLVGPDGVAAVGSDGCLKPTQPFTWSRWVDPSYDEVLNPPVYTPSVQQAVTRHLLVHRDQYCSSYARWANTGYRAHLEQVLRERPPYAGEEAPARSDPYQLDALCDGWSG